MRRSTLTLVCVLGLGWTLAGCGATRSQLASRLKRLDKAAALHAPDKHLVLLLLDGVQAGRFERMLDDGDLPNFKMHLVDRGVFVEQAVASLTSSTFPNIAGILTGYYPGHCNLPSNHIFERTDSLRRNFANWRNVYHISEELPVPTVFERLQSRYTATISSAVAKGSDIWLRNMLQTGLAYATGNWRRLDRQTLDQVGTLLELGELSGKAPHFIFAHLIGVDGVGHTLGPGSPEYEEHLRFIDEELGRLMERLQHAGLYDHTAFLVVADHGHASIETPLNMTRHFHLVLAEHASAEECTEQCRLPGLEVDGQPVLDTYDVVVTVGGYRDAVVYLQAPDREALLEALDDKSRTPVTEQALFSYLTHEGNSLNLIQSLVQEPAVGHVVFRAETPESFFIVNREGWGKIIRRRLNGTAQYQYRVVKGEDPLGYREDPALAMFIDEGFHASRAWLSQTIDATFPDLVPQIPELFDSPRMGDLLVTAAPGYGFRSKPGGHGGFTRDEMLVPFIMAGPGITPHRIETARNVDVTPLILHYLGFDDPNVLAQLDGQMFCPISPACPFRGPHPSVHVARLGQLSEAR